MDIVIGIAGAILGGFIMRTLASEEGGGMIYTINIATRRCDSHFNRAFLVPKSSRQLHAGSPIPPLVLNRRDL